MTLKRVELRQRIYTEIKENIMIVDGNRCYLKKSI